MNARLNVASSVGSACLLLVLVTGTLTSQQAPRVFTLQGVAFDSLHNRPIVGATIRILGRADSTLSDVAGKFHFDSVDADMRLISMEHPDIDAIGLSEITARGDFSTGHRDVVLAIPSFKTLWRGVCGGQQAPADSGFIYGAIRDARTQNGVAGIRVTLSWSEFGVGSNKKLRNTRYTLETRSDSLGAYVACGVPVDVPLQLSTGLSSDTDVVLDLPAVAARVQKRDVRIAPAMSAVAGATPVIPVDRPPGTLANVSEPAKPAEFTGTVEGVITNAAGGFLAQVIVSVGGGVETRSDSSGKFLLKGVPVGTRTLQYAAIGALPASRVVDVLAGETSDASIKMDRVSTLERVNVTATRVSNALRSFEERKRSGFGYIQDSTVVARTVTMAAMIRGFPSISVGKRNAPIVVGTGPSSCAANIFIDGRLTDISEFWSMNVDELAWVEVYPRRISTPPEFQTRRACGVIAIFSKHFLKH